MNIDSRILQILERAQAGIPPSRNECVEMLKRPATSLEASLTRSVADSITRRRFGNGAMVLGQIGIEIEPCPGRCRFCSLAEGHTQLPPGSMALDEILAHAQNLTASGDLCALFLMTTHTFDLRQTVTAAESLRGQVPQELQIVVNIGDFDLEQARLLKGAGVNGAYHVCRLREGEDTELSPDARIRTIRAIKDAGLEFYYCCEPIGPEHSAEEIVDQLFIGIEFGCFQHAAMRRVSVPGMPLAARGQISELRLAQVVAVIALAGIRCQDIRSIAVHEPNLIGLTSGANAVYAEAGANPRDTEEDTTAGRGRDASACLTMLHEAGFDNLITGPRTSRPITL